MPYRDDRGRQRNPPEFTHLTLPGGVLQWILDSGGIRRMRNDTTQRRGRSAVHAAGMPCAYDLRPRQPPTAPSDRAAPGLLPRPHPATNTIRGAGLPEPCQHVSRRTSAPRTLSITHVVRSTIHRDG